MPVEATPPHDMSAADGDRGLALARALSHPLRPRVLTYIATHGTGSAAEMAKAWGLSGPRVRYHVRCLESAGLLVLHERRAHRGGTEQRYRLAPEHRSATDADSPGNPAAIARLHRELSRLGASLNRARCRAGIELAAVAKEVGISPTMLEIIEAGSGHADLATIVRLADVVGAELIISPRLNPPQDSFGLGEPS